MSFHTEPICRAGVSTCRILGALWEEEREQDHLAVLGLAGVLPDVVSPGRGRGRTTQGEMLGALKVRSV